MTSTTDAQTITFTNGQELMMIAMVGIMRRLTGVIRKLPNMHGLKYDTWGMDIEAAAAEAAVARYLNLYWSPGGRLAKGDVGANANVQVRWSPNPNARLILHENDRNDQPYVLVTGTIPTFQLVGWILGGDGKDKRHWAEPVSGRAAYFVAPAHLLPLRRLRQHIHTQEV